MSRPTVLHHQMVGNLVPPGLLAGAEVGLRPGGEEDAIVLELGVGQSQ